MGFEWPSKKNQEVKKTREAVHKATEEADPTTYSSIAPPELQDRKKFDVSDYGKKIETKDGGYYEVVKDPEMQQFVSRVLKGIANVSDVVSVSDRNGVTRYYSRDVPLGKVQERTSLSEVEADLFILRSIFGDIDHSFTNGERRNVREEEGRITYFDFDGAKAFPGANRPDLASLGSGDVKMGKL